MGRYWVLEATYLMDLTSKVEEFIKMGWKPQGGVCVGSRSFYQAIVRD